MEPRADVEQDARDEEMVRILRGILSAEETIPLGLRSRLEAELRVVTARRHRPSWTALLVLAAVLFSVTAAGGPASLSCSALAVVAMGAAAYAYGLRALMERGLG